MAKRKKIVVELNGGVNFYEDDAGFPCIGLVGREVYSGTDFPFSWHLAEQTEFREFENFLKVTDFALQGKVITVIMKGDSLNGNFAVAVGNVKSKLFFWAASETPNGESRFLTDEEVEELLREL